MANDGFSFVEDLSVASDFFNMKARIIRKKIQAQCKNMLLSDFGQYLKEDSTIVIRRFGVAEQRDRVLPLNHKINLFKCSSIQSVTSFQGHLYDFDFVPFEEINDNRARDRFTIDVIGRIASCGDLDIFKNKEKESKRMNFELQDLNSQIIKCILWGKYAEQMNKFICNNKSTEMVIAILQHAKLKRFNRELSVQNDMYGTRLFLNEDIQEANDLRRGLILRDGVGAASQTILESQTVYPLHKEFVINTIKKNVDEIGECHEVCVIVFVNKDGIFVFPY
uniref:uncharacterized protein LOC122585533 n=1 Tax=Erigeron canadensis TaxID=72917 RepID=UPI001CB91912|nr:uncharacterized protein LOC122585533 [Erigeron canadensis]